MNLYAAFGVYGGALCGLLGWGLGRYFARKNRGIDEMYELIWQKARAGSWIVTMLAIYVFYTLLFSGVQINAYSVLGYLLLVHLVSWGLLGGYYSFKLRGYEEKQTTQASKTKLAIGIAVTVVLVFLIVSLATGNWKFFWFSLPPAFVSTMTTIYSGKAGKK